MSSLSEWSRQATVYSLFRTSAFQFPDQPHRVNLVDSRPGNELQVLGANQPSARARPISEIGQIQLIPRNDGRTFRRYDAAFLRSQFRKAVGLGRLEHSGR